MAGDVRVANISAALSTSAGGSTNFTKSGFGTPKACRITISFDAVDDTGVAVQSKVSIGLSDFTNNYCISHQDEDNSAKVDCDALKSNTKAYVVLDVGGSVLFSGTATTTTDGVTLTHTAGEAPSSGFFASVTMYGGADLAVSQQRTTINSSQDGTATIPHSGFTDGNDKIIFFIGTDIGQEDSANSGINNSFGVCHATGSDAGGWTLTQRCIGWASDHNNTVGTPHSILSTDRVLDIITEAGGQDWGLEVTNLDHSPAEWTVTTRDAGAGAGMEVYSLALDLDDRKAKVGEIFLPDSGTSWTPSVSLGFTPQYVGLSITDMLSLDTIHSNSSAAQLGISSNTGSGEETCHSWYNADNSAITDTNNLFRSRVIDFRNAGVLSTIFWDMSHSSFNDGDWTYAINSEAANVSRKAVYWTIEEAAVPDVTDEEWAGTLGFGQQEPVREPNEIVSY